LKSLSTGKELGIFQISSCLACYFARLEELPGCHLPFFLHSSFMPRPVQDLPHWCFQFEKAEDLFGETEPGQTEGD
jgi:hypothetical protein